MPGPVLCAGYKEDPVKSPRANKAAAAVAGPSAPLGFVLGSRAHMQVRSPEKTVSCSPSWALLSACWLCSCTPVWSQPLVCAASQGLAARPHALQDSATAKRSALRNFLMHGFHVLVMMVVGNQIRDTQCGFKVRFRRGSD